MDSVAIIAPLGLAFGRLGNYVNNELFGFAPYHGPFAMIINGVPHFPSPLLEAFLEGFLLFFLLIVLYKKTNWKNIIGRFSGIFAVWYAASRIIVEFFRLPDANIGYLFGTNFVTLGMLYSIPILFVGLYLLFRK